MENKKVEDVLSRINKDLGAKIVTIGFANEERKRVPSSSITLNWMTHGGLCRGTIVEFYGRESSGKTTTAVDFAKNLTKILKSEGKGQMVAYADLECSLDAERCMMLGLNPSETIIIQPDGNQSGEDVLNALLDMLREGIVGGVILDSIPTLVTRDELDKDLTKDPKRGGVAALMTRFLREAVPLVAKNDVLFVLVNQIRDSQDPYKPFTTPGGKAVKFYSSARLDFMPGHYLNEKGEEISGNSDTAWGMQVKVRIVKAKGFAPDRLLGQFPLSFMGGIDEAGDLASLMLATRAIAQAGSWFTIFDESGVMEADDAGRPAKAQGLGKIVSMLRENPGLMERCKERYSK